MDKVDMSLDDIIKSQKGQGGAGRKFGGRGRGRGPPRVAGGGVGGARGARRNTLNFKSEYIRASGNIDGRWQHDMYDGPARRLPQSMGSGQGSSKLIVANLDFGVSDSDVTELFGEFGNLKHASIHYDRSGRSLGIADIIFERRADATKAMMKYNNVPLDGRPMKIKFADEAAQPVRSPAGPANRMTGRIQRPASGRPRGGRGGFRGRGGFGRGGGGAKRSQVTAEDLDAELDAYKMSG